MLPRPRLRLRHRYFAAIMLLVAAAMAAVALPLILQYERSMAATRARSSATFDRALHDQFANGATGLALVTAEALVNPLALLNVEGTRDAIQAARAEPDVVSVVVVDHAGLALFTGSNPAVRPSIAELPRPRVHEFKGPRIERAPGRMAVSAPVRLGDQLLGVVTITLSTARIDSAIAALSAELSSLNEDARRGRLISLIVIAGSVAIAAGLSAILMARSLSGPIQALSGFTARIGRGDERLTVAVDRTDELGELARALETMRCNLKRSMVSRDAFDRVLNSMRDGLVVTTSDGTILDVNRACTALLGRDKDTLLGRDLGELLPSGLPHRRRGGALAASGLQESAETWLPTASGTPVPVLLSAAVMQAPAGGSDGLVWVFHDITERRRAEQQIRYMAHHDALTGLPNRVLLHDRLQKAIALAQRRQEAVALLLIDLDDFKDVNDTYGHATGDAVLRAVARRIQAAVRTEDRVGRLGGDEFLAVLRGVGDPAVAGATAERILTLLDEPVHVGDVALRVHASVGVATADEVDGLDATTLVDQADRAMYLAKEHGGSRFHRLG